ADRVHRHLFNGGALTPAAAAERFRTWSDRLDRAIIAESARWGNYRREVHPYKVGPYALYTRDDHWRPEIERRLPEYFPPRTRLLLQQLREAGLYPAIDAPTLSVVDGTLALSVPVGIIFYTDNGTDPRELRGQVSAGAREYETPLAVPPGGKIKARAAT